MKQVQSPTTASLSARAGLNLVIFLPPRVLGLQVCTPYPAPKAILCILLLSLFQPSVGSCTPLTSHIRVLLFPAETRSHCVSQAGPHLVTFLPQPPE